MKNIEIEILSKVVHALEQYLPETEKALFNDYLRVYETFKAKNDAQKRYYQKKAEYHRAFSKKWREDNPERHKENQRKYQVKKRQESEQIKAQHTGTGIATNSLQTDLEYCLLLTASPHLFIGEKPVSVLFGTERVEVKSWHDVYGVILTRCNQDEKYHQLLMYLRGKAAGKCRVFLSDTPDTMKRPIKIDEGLYGETHYGSQTLMHILVNRILFPIGFDCRNVSVVLKARER